jgi:DNA-binding NarL/FixJ family response regulator
MKDAKERISGPPLLLWLTCTLRSGDVRLARRMVLSSLEYERISKAMSVTIILVDDHDAIRQAQRCILETEADFEIIGEACNGREAIELVEQSQPDVVIMDIFMPEISGIEATRRLHQSCPDVKLIGFPLDATKPFILSMLNAGASGFVSKQCPASESRMAVLTVLKGETHVSPEKGSLDIQF